MSQVCSSKVKVTRRDQRYKMYSRYICHTAFISVPHVICAERGLGHLCPMDIILVLFFILFIFFFFFESIFEMSNSSCVQHMFTQLISPS